MITALLRRSTGMLTVALLATTGATSAESLTDAWVLAQQHDQSLAATRTHAEAAAFDAQAARAQRRPTVTVGGAYSRLDDSPAFDFSWTGLPLQSPPLFEHDTLATGAATVTVPVFTSGRISSDIAAAEARAQAADARVDATSGDVRLAVAESYVGVLRARKALAVTRSNVRTLESLERDTGSLFERELVPRNELLTARVALANARQEALRAANTEVIALATYNRRLGAALDRPVELDDAVDVPSGMPESLEALTEQALARRAELAMLDAQAEAYGRMARTERSRALPQVVLTGSYQYLGNRFLDDETVAMAGVGVQWALFDGGQARKRAAALERTQRATTQQRADAESLIALQVREAWLAWQEARQRIELTAHAAEQSDESLRIAQERYAAGLGTQTQLLEAEAFRVQSWRNRDEAALDARLAQLRLARAAGML